MIFLPVIHLIMSGQNAKFQSHTICTFGFKTCQPVKYNPCRTMPEVQKFHSPPSPLLVPHEKYNILKMLCQILLKTFSLLNIRVLDQNLMIKRERKLCSFLKRC